MKKELLVLLFFINNTFLAHPDFIVSYNIINKNKIVVTVNRAFSKQFIKEDFFAEYDESIDLTNLDESIITIPLILNIIPVVWFSNKKYAIDVMDEDLYYSLQKIREVFQIFYPKHKWAGELVPKKLIKNTIHQSNDANNSTLALLFSCGLDSVETSLNYIDTKQLLITVWGADVKIKDNDKWQAVHKQVQQFARQYGHEYTVVKSNFREFIETDYLYNKFPRWWVRASFGLSFVGLTAPLLVQKNIATLFIASSNAVNYPYPLGSHPAIENNVSFAERAVCLTSGDKDRVQKIKSINAICKEKGLQLPYLRVCWSDPTGGNCLLCEKCLRSCVNIVAAGQLPHEYGFIIDIKSVTQRLKKVFIKKKKTYLPFTHLFIWQYNMSHLDMLCGHKFFDTYIYKEEIKELNTFLHSINFRRYRNPRTPAYSLQEKELFTTIWEQYTKKGDEIIKKLLLMTTTEK